MILAPLVWRKGLAGIGWRGAFWLTLGAGFPYAIASTAGLKFAPAGHFGVIAPSCMLIASPTLLINGKFRPIRPQAAIVPGRATRFKSDRCILLQFVRSRIDVVIPLRAIFSFFRIVRGLSAHLSRFPEQLVALQ